MIVTIVLLIVNVFVSLFLWNLHKFADMNDLIFGGVLVETMQVHLVIDFYAADIRLVSFGYSFLFWMLHLPL